MKKIITIAIVMLLALNINAQENTYKCPKGFDADKLLEYPVEIDKLRPQLRVIRQWARNNDKPQVVIVTSRLEYWAKDIARYIRRYAESNTDKVCERLMKKNYQYLSDFVTLTFPLLDIQYPTIQSRVNEVDINKYH